AHFQDYRDRLAATLDVNPSARTTTLIQLLGQPNGANGYGSESAQGPILHPTPLIGRETLLMDISAWIAESEQHLLTLVGPGGIGKTRAAAATADLQRRSDRFPDGVFFVSLAAYSSPAQIAPAVA